MRRQDGTFEEDIQCIIEPSHKKGGIYISNIEAASNPLTLQKLNIGAVITAAKGKNLAETIPKHIEYLYIPAIDHQSFDISVYFKLAHQLLDQQLPRTNVLVHCMAGVSRSVTLVIAYLMRSKGLSFCESFQFMKSKRKIMNPNQSFIKQLQKYEQQLKKSDVKKSEQQSTSSSWFHVTKSGNCEVIAKQLDSYDVQLKNKIKHLFQVKRENKRQVVAA